MKNEDLIPEYLKPYTGTKKTIKEVIDEISNKNLSINHYSKILQYVVIEKAIQCWGAQLSLRNMRKNCLQSASEPR